MTNTDNQADTKKTLTFEEYWEALFGARTPIEAVREFQLRGCDRHIERTLEKTELIAHYEAKADGYTIAWEDMEQHRERALDVILGAMVISLDRAVDIARAHLEADAHGVFSDDATQRRYWAGKADLACLGREVHIGRPSAYSHWVAEGADLEEVPDGYQVATVDVIGTRACGLLLPSGSYVIMLPIDYLPERVTGEDVLCDETITILTSL